MENCAVFKTFCQYGAAVCFRSDALGILAPDLVMNCFVLMCIEIMHINCGKYMKKNRKDLNL